MTQKAILIIASLSGALAVSLGAFGAHAFKNTLESLGRTGTFDTAVLYHFVHTVALLAAALMMDKFDTRYLQYASLAFIFGIILFSGSLYTLSLTGQTKLGMIAPLGGIAFIAGWVLLLVSVAKS